MGLPGPTRTPRLPPKIDPQNNSGNILPVGTLILGVKQPQVSFHVPLVAVRTNAVGATSSTAGSSGGAGMLGSCPDVIEVTFALGHYRKCGSGSIYLPFDRSKSAGATSR
jgi:hypothetical protein